MNNIRCPLCNHRYSVFRFSYAWHLWRMHDITLPTPPSGWTQGHAEQLSARRWQ